MSWIFPFTPQKTNSFKNKKREDAQSNTASSLICGILKNQNKRTAKQNKTRFKETKNKMKFARRAGGEEVGE